MYNERKKVYTMQYIKDHCDRISVNVPKGKKAEYMKLAKVRGMSLSRLIISLLEYAKAKTKPQ